MSKRVVYEINESMPVSLSGIIHHSHSFTRLETYHHIYFNKNLIFFILILHYLFMFLQTASELIEAGNGKHPDKL